MALPERNFGEMFRKMLMEVQGVLTRANFTDVMLERAFEKHLKEELDVWQAAFEKQGAFPDKDKKAEFMKVLSRIRRRIDDRKTPNRCFFQLLEHDERKVDEWMARYDGHTDDNIITHLNNYDDYGKYRLFVYRGEEATDFAGAWKAELTRAMQDDTGWQRVWWIVKFPRNSVMIDDHYLLFAASWRSHVLHLGIESRSIAFSLINHGRELLEAGLRIGADGFGPENKRRAGEAFTFVRKGVGLSWEMLKAEGRAAALEGRQEKARIAAGGAEWEAD